MPSSLTVEENNTLARVRRILSTESAISVGGLVDQDEATQELVALARGVSTRLQANPLKMTLDINTILGRIEEAPDTAGATEAIQVLLDWLSQV